MWWWTCFVIFCVAAAAENKSSEEKWREVKIAQGVVRGHRHTSGELYTFFNIPYATAPTGNNKFKAPLPPPTWKDTFDAIDRNIICPQVTIKPFMADYLVAQENCLVANVFVPDTEEKNLSVLVNVHGGGFQVGYGDWLRMTNFMKSKDIIVVNFNYRLGIHGFLCLGTEDAPGNAGMKDQVALLRWVQENIAAFGGNPNDVTIEGSSAGSGSVDLLMISKTTKGLFHKVIPESGANLGTFAIQSDPLQFAKDYAKTLNFTNVDDFYALKQFYKELTYDIMTAGDFMDQIDYTFMFGPCIERDADEEAFLTETPMSILKRGDYQKVPLLYGYANMEGLFRVPHFDELGKIKMNKKFSDFLPRDLKFETEDEKEEVAKKVKEFYFGDKPIDNNNILRYVDYYSDITIAYAMLLAVKLHAEAGHDQVYLYEYSFVTEDTPVVPHTNVRGAEHCAQTMAISDGGTMLTLNINEDTLSAEYKNMKKIIREIWHNFVRTGKPVPKGSNLPTWPPAGADRSPHMSLGQKVALRGVLSEESALFWDKIYQKYYRHPIPPPQPPARPRLEL